MEKTKILLVDDRMENILALSRLIEDDDVEVVCSTSGYEALSLLLDHEFALALLDVNMPEMSGLELARLMRGAERCKNIPIIFVTAVHAGESSIFQGYEHGAVDYLLKPIDPHVVRSKVRVFVELDQQRKRLRQLKDEAESASLAKGRFLANMSHEIRTPLASVLGFAQLLRAGEIPESERQSYTDAIIRNGEHLSRLLDDVLDLSKIEAGHLEVEKRSISLRDLLEDFKVTMGLRAREKGLVFECACDDDVPERIHTDAIRLRQILTNLLGNALKFTHRGKVSLRVSNDRATDGGAPHLVRFEVADTGTGMEAEAAARLFAPFTQADSSTTRKYGGTGLGLSISRQLARALGGDVVVVRTAPNLGTTFAATIDPELAHLAQEAAAARVDATAPQPESEDPPNLERLRVLLVDDMRDNLLLVSRMLSLSGAKVDCVDNAKDAIQRALSDEFDVVLMDLQMPDLDGYEATSLLRRYGYDRPIIALTAHSVKEELERCLTAGCDTYLSKPVNRSALVRSVAKIRRGSQGNVCH